jgi:uncharacterized Zn-binding protein involved in type VI secretion
MPGEITRTTDPTIPFGANLILGSTNVKVGGNPVALQGSPITPHGPIPGHGEVPGIMNQSSLTVKVNGQGVVRQGDIASCGDAATGFPTVRAGD